MLQLYSKIIKNKTYLKNLINYFSFHKKSRKFTKFGKILFDEDYEVVEG